MADDSEWIEWAGGECPVAGDTLVNIRLRCGDENGAMRADFWSAGATDWWRHDPSPVSGNRYDIIAYRVVQS